MRAFAVVVHWGHPGPAVALASWLADSPSVDGVTVVANDAGPRPADLAAEIGWLVPDRNLGYAGGFLAAVETRPDADCYLLLNNDVRLTEDTLGECLGLAAGERVGVVAPTLVNDDGIQSAAGTLSRLLAAPRVLEPAGPTARNVDWVTGAALVIRGDCLREVGLDGRYFLGFEDVDLCYRARDAGWRVVLTPRPAWHRGGGSIRGDRYVFYIVRNRLWFGRSRRWRARTALIAAWSALYFLPRMVVGDVVRGRRPACAPLALHGLIDGLARMPPGRAPRADEPRPARWISW